MTTVLLQLQQCILCSWESNLLRCNPQRQTTRTHSLNRKKTYITGLIHLEIGLRCQFILLHTTQVHLGSYQTAKKSLSE